MKDKKDFYIGWQEKMPDSQRRRIRWFVIGALVLIPLLTILVSFYQRPFNDHTFELGTIKPITGTYVSTPVPVLIADAGQLPEGLSPHILLVGFGKFGAERIMETIAATAGELEGQKITLEGTLIYGDGKTVMELTKKAKSFVEILGQGTGNPPTASPLMEASLHGEILDPKCYFGVMKPGEGKIHKSCATRCISGGIPPVFRTRTAEGTYAYYLLVGKNGEKINQAVLTYIAEAIEVQGQTQDKAGWDVLYVDMESEGAIRADL